MVRKSAIASVILAVITASSGITMAQDTPKTNGKLEVLPLEQEDILFTGKPYIKTLGYVFHYRNYDPQINRWTTSDPSGFPDGANNQIYAPVPTNDLDYQGLLKWSTLTDTGMSGPSSEDGNSIMFDLWTVKTDDGASTIQLFKYVSGAPAGTDYTYNCAGYVFALKAAGDPGYLPYWIQGSFIPAMLAGDGYTQITGTNYTGAKIAVWGDHVAWVGNDGVDANGVVTEVTGKKGATVGLTTSTPADQWGGDVTYWE